MSLFLGALAYGVCGAQVRQSAAEPSAARPPDRPAGPRSLPADNLPPFGMLNAAGELIPIPNELPEALHRGSGAPPESTAPSPLLAQAVDAARAALDACANAGFPVGVAVVDSAGEARAMLTADSADGSHVFVAMRKALTAVVFHTASSTARELVGRDKSALARVTPNMFVVGGAVPIFLSHRLIGAIGVSGAGGTPIGHQDELCASAGVRRFASTGP
jgi:uncharacterized protein GlcG (DUF336 family)